MPAAVHTVHRVFGGFVMKRLLGFAGLVLLVSLVLVGCATITKGTRQIVSIGCNVDGADVLLDGVKVGVTPFVGEIAKNRSTIMISKQGYRSETLALSKSLEGMFWGNIITGGTVGSITDFATGAAYTYAPATYHVELQATSQSSLEFGQQLGTRKFAMLFIDEISRDLAAGDGQYLDALLRIMNADTDRGTSVPDVRAAFLASEGNQEAFGRELVRIL
jgi:hypothetical protein